jgi:hypothetical protein
MAEVKHTPGPWSVEDPMGADVGLWIVQSGLEPRQWSCIAIVTDDENGQARDEGGRFIGRLEQEANARLIAAAPAMLEMLRECRATFAFAAGEGDDPANDLVAEIDAVLAKAVA